MKYSLFITVIIAMTMLSCQKDKGVYPKGYYKSPEQISMGDGHIYSWVRLGDHGRPEALGFTLNTAALNNLPDTGFHHGVEQVYHYYLPFPLEASVTPFNHIGIDWNPHGHEPGPYTKAHFDMHFYKVTHEDRALIGSYEEDSLQFMKAPEEGYLPPGYFYPGGGVPNMGAHWIDLNSPELKDQEFTETFIYGTFDGDVNFIEPMITYDFLKNTTDYSRSIPRPEKVRRTGYHPTTMRVYRIGDEISVSLEDMEYRIGTQAKPEL